MTQNTELKVTTSILDAFNSLRDPNEQVKLTGGVRIISTLQKNENERDIQYALKRLVRSIGANHLDMRTGYYVTLVAFLQKFQNITVSQLIDLVNKELHPSSSTKSEVGDVSLGQILVCGAIFRSRLILKSSIEERKAVINMMISASTKKSYLSTVTYLLLVDLINTLSEEEFISIVWNNIKNEFKKEFKMHNLDTLYFLMVAQSQFPSKIKICKLLGVNDILCEDTIHILCEKLMEVPDLSAVNHPIYDYIGSVIANSPHLLLFWTSGIDSQLIKHNRNRELVSLNILISILNNISKDFSVLPELISKNFFKLFLDWFKGLQTASKFRHKNDEEDHKIIIKKEKDLLNVLAKTMKSENVDPKLRVEVLKKLLFDPGEMNLTEITGSTLVKSIIADLDKDGVKKMAKLFKGVLLNQSRKCIKEGVERNWYNNERLKAAEAISYLVTHETMKDDTHFKLNYMKLLMCFGFFKIGGDENVPISAELGGAIKSSFYRCFSSRFSTTDNLLEVLHSLCSFLDTNIKNEKVFEKLKKQFPNENMECWTLLISVCQNIEKNKNKAKVDKVFLILLYQLGLFLFSEPKHVKVSQSSIKELKSCYDHYKKENNKTQKIIQGDSSNEPEWIEVMTEVLLSILSTDSTVLRSVVQCVFRLLWEYLTPSCIGQIMSVLDPDESNPLTQDEESEHNSDSGSDDSNDDNGSDNDSDDNNETSNDSGDEDDDNLKTPDQLRMAVQKALGAAAPDTDTESIDADMINEDEGKKLDEALSEAFKMFQGKNKKSKDQKDKKSLSDFRIKVLDLVDIYLEKDPAMDVCLAMISPLIRCLEFSLQDTAYKELETRLRKSITLLSKIKKFSTTADISMADLCDYMKSTIEKGQRSHFMYQALGDVITKCATFVVHCSQKINRLNIDDSLITIYKDSLQNFFLNRSCLLPIIFFHNILQIEWEANYALIPIIIVNAFSVNVRQFRRNEALELLAGFYRSLNRIKPSLSVVGEKLNKIEVQFENAVKNAMSDQNKEFVAKNNYFLTLKKVVNIMKMFHETCHHKSSVDFKVLLELISSGKINKKSKNEPTVQIANMNSEKGKKRKKKKKNKHLNGFLEPKVKKLKMDVKL